MGCTKLKEDLAKEEWDNENKTKYLEVALEEQKYLNKKLNFMNNSLTNAKHMIGIILL